VCLSMTRPFSDAVKEVMSAMFPFIAGDEERWDTRRILFDWICKSGDLVGSSAAPSNDPNAHDGVPVALLPLIFGCDRSRTKDKSTEERYVYVPALWMRKEFMQAFQILQSYPRDTLLDQIDFGDAGARFASWCKPFCVAYTHYMCNPHVPFMKEMVAETIVQYHEQFLLGGEEDVHRFLQTKAMFFGLFQYSYTLEDLETDVESESEEHPNSSRLVQIHGPVEDA
jgi:hypothetical protein